MITQQLPYEPENIAVKERLKSYFFGSLCHASGSLANNNEVKLTTTKHCDSHYGRFLLSDPTFVASWLKWLQMILNEFKRPYLIFKTHGNSFWVISDHFESIKSWGNKISYTINMQCSLPFFAGSQIQTLAKLPGMSQNRSKWLQLQA